MSKYTRLFCRLVRRKTNLNAITRGYVVKNNETIKTNKEGLKKMIPGNKAHIIVVGNEKGGSGKTTTAMHITCSLLHQGFEVGIIDLDIRQRSFTRYMENRLSWMDRRDIKLPMPRCARVRLSENPDLSNAKAEDIAMTNAAIDRLIDADFIVIDTPGSNTYPSHAAHARADTIITPMNDSFIDFDLLAHIDPDTMEVVAPSVYSDLVWNSRKIKARNEGGNIDWVVMRNRLSPTNTHNKVRVMSVLDNLSQRYGFRVANGFTERVIYREMFLAGLTLLDLTDKGSGIEMGVSHVASRQEIRKLMATLQLPNVSVYAMTAE